ncbi:MAG: SIR2 family protein [Gemmatimonadetes bacterium]|nr:SIR2 family protein [Gemmatimonadota bacterium]
MWFLGAGASASAGLPTAMDMIWEFKQALFISRNRGSSQASVDLSQPAVRNRIDAYIKSLGGMPSPGDSNEYASLFEAAYPAELDRRTVIDGKLAGAKPSYGHMVLATLMRHELIRMVWTTNFDALVADACAKVFDTTSALTTIDLDSASQAHQALADERWPMEIKLHGDFRSRRLKNTNDELRQQDAHLRRVLVDSCKRFGLVVCGYSGRDDSIMDALEETIEHENAFPTGLFWLHREGDPLLPRVTQLLNRSSANDVEATLVSVENFDEILRDLVSLTKDIDTTALDQFAAQRQPWSPVPLQKTVRRGWPVVRLNALPVINAPAQCHRLVCDIGGTAEVRKAVQKAGVDVLAVRSKIGVLAFGTDADVRDAFASYGINEFDLHAFDVKRQRYESTERGLLGEALNRAISRHGSLKIIGRRRFVPADPKDAIWDRLRELVGNLTGVVNGNPNLQWWEGITVRLDWANDRLWLLVEPCTVFDGITGTNKMAVTDFARERTIKRYNRELNDLVDFWAHHVSQNGEDMRALNTGHGVDAIFRISPATCFSDRLSS